MKQQDSFERYKNAFINAVDNNTLGSFMESEKYDKFLELLDAYPEKCKDFVVELGAKRLSDMLSGADVNALCKI